MVSSLYLSLLLYLLLFETRILRLALKFSYIFTLLFSISVCSLLWEISLNLSSKPSLGFSILVVTFPLTLIFGL